MLLFSMIFSLFTAIGEVDLIVPSFSEMQNIFGLSPFMVELALSLNLLSHLIAALFAATLADRYGRKKVMLYGFIVYMAGSIIGALAHDFNIILLGRILQGAGVAPVIVLAYLIAIDNYPTSEQGRVMGLLNGSVALSLSLAPVLGSYVTDMYGYQGNFWLMLFGGGAAALILTYVVPKDKEYNPEAKFGLGHYMSLLKHRKAMLYVTFVSLMIATYYTFVGTASLLFIQGFGLDLSEFGFFMASATLTYGLLSIFSGSLIIFFGKKTLFKVSISFLLFHLVASAYLLFHSDADAILVLAVSLIFVLGMVIPVNEGFVMALESMEGGQARASALIGTLKWVFTIIGVQTASHFFHGAYLPIVMTLMLMIGFSMIILLFAYTKDDSFSKMLSSSEPD